MEYTEHDSRLFVVVVNFCEVLKSFIFGRILVGSCETVSSYSDITIKLRKDMFEDITEHPTFTLGSGTGWHQQLEMWEIKQICEFMIT